MTGRCTKVWRFNCCNNVQISSKIMVRVVSCNNFDRFEDVGGDMKRTQGQRLSNCRHNLRNRYFGVR